MKSNSQTPICSERKMRRKQETLLKDNLVGKRVQLFFSSTAAAAINGLEMKDVPFVHVKDLASMITDYLDRLDRYFLVKG